MNVPEVPFRIETTGRVPHADPPGRRLVAFVTYSARGGGGRMFTDPTLVPGVHPIDANDGWMASVINPRAKAWRLREEEAQRQQEGRLL